MRSLTARECESSCRLRLRLGLTPNDVRAAAYQKDLPPGTRGPTRLDTRRSRARRHRAHRDLSARLDVLGIAASSRAEDAVAGTTVRRARQLRGNREGSALLGGARSHGVLYRRLDLARAVDRSLPRAGDEP